MDGALAETVYLIFKLLLWRILDKQSVGDDSGTLLLPRPHYRYCLSGPCLYAIVFPAEELEVRLGEHDRFSEGETTISKTYRVVMMIKHPSYNDPTSENDMGLVKLATPADISIYTPACLPATGSDFTGQTTTLAG